MLQLICDGKDMNTFNVVRSGGDVLAPPESGRVLCHRKNEKNLQCKETPEVKIDFLNCKANKFGTSEFSWIDNFPSCPVYYPTKEDFEDPSAYIRTIAPVASKYGKILWKRERVTRENQYNPSKLLSNSKNKRLKQSCKVYHIDHSSFISRD